MAALEMPLPNQPFLATYLATKSATLLVDLRTWVKETSTPRRKDLISEIIGATSQGGSELPKEHQAMTLAQSPSMPTLEIPVLTQKMLASLKANASATDTEEANTFFPKKSMSLPEASLITHAMAAPNLE